MRVIRNNRIQFVVLSVVASAINYVFQIYIGNVLSAENYGIYNYEIAYITNLYSLFTPLAILVCQYISDNERQLVGGDNTFRRLFYFSILVLFISFIFFIFHFDDGNSNILLVVLMYVCVSYCTLLLGVVQGLARYMEYGLFNALLMALKLFMAFLIPKSLRGVFISIIFSEFILFVIIFLFLFQIRRKEQRANSSIREHIMGYDEIIKVYSGAFITQAMYSLYINNGELILMRKRFEDRIIGIYSVAALLCRVAVYLTTIISTIILPEVSYLNNKDQKATSRILYKSIACSMSVAVVYSVALLVVKDILISWLYGERYMDACSYIPYMIPFVVGISMLPIINNFFLGIKRSRYLFIFYLLGITVCYIITSAFALRIETLLLLYGVVILLIVVVGIFVAYCDRFEGGNI